MIALFLIALAAFAISLAVTPLARAVALRLGMVDQPDARRKMHGREVPMAGGLALFVAVAAVVAAVTLVPGWLGEELRSSIGYLIGLGCAAVVICALGIADDSRGIRGRHKLLGQCAAVGIVLASGVVVEKIQLFGWGLDLGLLALPLTGLFLLAAINSLNLIDGMDGLLGSIGLIISAAVAVMAASAGHWAVAAVAAALGGGLLGFLRHNFPPATIFMGDAGSMLVGLVIGVLAIRSSLKAPATIGIALPIGLLTLPFFDTAAAIVRRKLTGRSLYTTDRGHLHHCLLRRGFSTRWALALASACCLATCVAALASHAFNNELIVMATGAALICILIVTRLFGHAEWLLVKNRVLAAGASWFQGPVGSRSQSVEVRLQGSADWNSLWETLVVSAERLNLSRLRLDVNAPALHEGYHASWDQVHDETKEDPTSWRVEVPLSAGEFSLGRLELAGDLDVEPMHRKIATVIKIVEDFEREMHRVACPPTPPPVGETVSASADA